MSDSANPYAGDPARHPAIVVNSATPFNGETPLSLITDRYRGVTWVENYMVTSYTWPCFFWYLGNSDLSSVHVYRCVHWQVTFYWVPDEHGHVKLVTLYKSDSLGNKNEHRS